MVSWANLWESLEELPVVVVLLKRAVAAALGVPRGRWPLIMAPIALIGSVLLGSPLLTLAVVLWLAPRLPLLLFFLLYPEEFLWHPKVGDTTKTDCLSGRNTIDTSR